MTGTVYFHLSEVVGQNFVQIHQAIADLDPSWKLEPGVSCNFEVGDFVIWDIQRREEEGGIFSTAR